MKMEFVIMQLMKQTLLFGEACLPKSQFKAFKKLVMDHFHEVRRQYGEDRDGKKSNDDEGGGAS